MQQAAEKILGVTTDAQKIAVIDQIDSSNKRLRALKHELEKLSPLVSDSRALSPSDSKDVSKIITYMCISLCGVTELYLFQSLEKVHSTNDVDRSATIASEAQQLKKEIEEQLEDETKKRDALSKLALIDAKKKSRDANATTSKDVEVELLTTDRIIAKLKGAFSYWGLITFSDETNTTFMKQKISRC